MTHEDLGKIKDRIQKLLNMTAEKGCTEAEAQVAMQMAQKLLIQYNLQMEEIIGAQTEKDMAVEMCAEFYAVSGNFNWHKYLTCFVAKHNMCTGVMKGYKNSSHHLFDGKRIEDSGYGVFIFGRRMNVQATKVMVEWISIQLEYLATAATRAYDPYNGLPANQELRHELGRLARSFGREVVSKQQFRNSFLWGAINRVNERLYASRTTALDNDPNTKAIVLDREAEAKNYQSEQMETKKTNANQNLDHKGYYAGREAGDTVSFGGSHHIEANNKLRLGSG